MNTLRKRVLSTMAVVATGLLGAGLAFGQQLDEYGDIAQTVARIAVVEGNVSYARGDDPDNWQAADVNVPVTLGDHLYTDQQSRAELQVHGGDVVRLGARTDLSALNLTDDTRQFALKSGVATFEIRRLDDNETWEVDTPNSAVTLEREGRYRVEVDTDGNSRISVTQGEASVAAGGGQVAVNSGERMKIDGIDSPRYDVESIGAPDGWDRWNEERETRRSHARSYQYLSQDVSGGDDLDQYGQWQQVPNYGWAWSPASVEAGWTPYRVGHWGWQDPWGWTWISTEPWGWAPYHYGRWVNASSRWYWIPVAPSVQVVAYSPALVGFVGGGPGFSASVTIGSGGFVGWFPLGPREPVNAWWSPRRDVNVNVTNVTYVNRTYVTVVNQNTFVSGGVVTNNIVRDRTVVQQVSTAPVVRGALPVIPTVASTRVAVRTAAAPRPPAAIVSRAVVARVAPPPAPPRFEQKLATIRQNGGAPVAPRVSAQIATQGQGQPRTVATIRPVAAEPGRVSLAPSRTSPGGASAAAPRVQPVAPARGGRVSASTEHPVSAAPVGGQRSGRAQPNERGAQPMAQPQRPAAEPQQAPPARMGSVPTPDNRSLVERERSQNPAGRERVQPTPFRPEREAAPGSRPPSDRERVQTQTWRERQATPARPDRSVAPDNRPPAERFQRAPQPTPDRSERNAAPNNRPSSERFERPTPARPERSAAPENRPAAERFQRAPQPTPDRRSREAVAPEARPQTDRERVQSNRPPERPPTEARPAPDRSRAEKEREQPKKKPKPTEPPG